MSAAAGEAAKAKAIAPQMANRCPRFIFLPLRECQTKSYARSVQVREIPRDSTVNHLRTVKNSDTFDWSRGAEASRFHKKKRRPVGAAFQSPWWNLLST